jgi:hypothetical protein
MPSLTRIYLISFLMAASDLFFREDDRLSLSAEAHCALIASKGFRNPQSGFAQLSVSRGWGTVTSVKCNRASIDAEKKI